MSAFNTPFLGTLKQDFDTKAQEEKLKVEADLETANIKITDLQAALKATKANAEAEVEDANDQATDLKEALKESNANAKKYQDDRDKAEAMLLSYENKGQAVLAHYQSIIDDLNVKLATANQELANKDEAFEKLVNRKKAEFEEELEYYKKQAEVHQYKLDSYREVNNDNAIMLAKLYDELSWMDISHQKKMDASRTSCGTLYTRRRAAQIV
ncbi:hypothetical protein B0H66DRAFT_618390 [Apodospora peruviana]|uniref:Uncharacterized protein n=1 Tax=Apodospora peruviana TaxID=516989 RepID=A0AAE0HRV2_9PEZI|nr:hypothetical protein B0H66DRAFT_618390 [Apodospora peruviana]